MVTAPITDASQKGTAVADHSAGNSTEHNEISKATAQGKSEHASEQPKEHGKDSTEALRRHSLQAALTPPNRPKTKTNPKRAPRC